MSNIGRRASFEYLLFEGFHTSGHFGHSTVGGISKFRPGNEPPFIDEKTVNIVRFGLMDFRMFEVKDIPELSEDRWTYRQRLYDENLPCMKIQPSSKDIIKRFYAILPFFDRDHANTAFLRKYRGTVHGLTDTEDLLDREAAYHAAVLTPLVFLHQYRDTWCLLERFHRALRLYQISHPMEKRSSLKLLQNFRAVNDKVRMFVLDLPGTPPVTRTTPFPEDDDEIHDKKDIRYLKELIKNLG